jgi:hypothetical protein
MFYIAFFVLNAAPQTIPPAFKACKARTLKSPRLDKFARSSSLAIAAETRGSSLFLYFGFNIGKVFAHRLQSTHFAASMRGYRKPSAFSQIAIAPLGQMSAHVPQLVPIWQKLLSMYRSLGIMGQVIMNRINKKRLGKSENVSVHSTMLVE